MEEAEKRKQRLAAMKQAAFCTQNTGDSKFPATPNSLDNPLAHTPGTPIDHVSLTPSRFDFYSDPTRIFNKRKGTTSDQGLNGHHIPGANHGSPAGKFLYFPPRPEMSPPQHSRGMYRTMTPCGNMSTPSRMRYTTPETRGRSSISSTGYYTPDQRGLVTPVQAKYSPGFSGSGPPSSGYGSSPLCGSQKPQRPRFGSSQSPSFRPRVSSTKKLGPECFYLESMVQDPWQNLQPVSWKKAASGSTEASTPLSSSSWLPQSIAEKRSPVATDPFSNSRGKQSLAEYLAASFNNAVDAPCD